MEKVLFSIARIYKVKKKVYFSILCSHPQNFRQIMLLCITKMEIILEQINQAKRFLFSLCQGLAFNKQIIEHFNFHVLV